MSKRKQKSWKAFRPQVLSMSFFPVTDQFFAVAVQASKNGHPGDGDLHLEVLKAHLLDLHWRRQGCNKSVKLYCLTSPSYHDGLLMFTVYNDYDYIMLIRSNKAISDDLWILCVRFRKFPVVTTTWRHAKQVVHNVVASAPS